MFDHHEYAKQVRAVNNTPLYRASCPPADELASLRDSAIEEIAEDIIAVVIMHPDHMAEMILENGYEQEGLKELSTALCEMMDNPTMETRLEFAHLF